MPPKKKPKRSPRDDIPRTRIYLWRHPEVMGGPEGKFWGQTDVGLTKRGQNQAKVMARFMDTVKVNDVYSSDLLRCVLPADMIARQINARQRSTPVEDFRELNLGEWEGKTYQEIDKRYPGALAQRAEDLAGYVIEGGESLAQLAERVMPAFQEMVGDNPKKTLCMVAHAGVNRVILTKLMGAPLDRVFRVDQEYACLNLIDVFEDGLPLIRGVNQPLKLLAAMLNQQGPVTMQT